MRIHGRTRLLIGVTSLAFAALPASAMAAHDLGIYKVEKHLDLTSDETTHTLACNAGDLAMDGMWRIDHADYDVDDDYATSLGRAVDVEAAYPVDTAADAETVQKDGYFFEFNKNAIGRAQVKVFATCLRFKTEQADSHEHNLVVTPRAAVTDADGAYSSVACGGNQFVAQTGFEILHATPAEPDAHVGHVKESWPTDVKTWSWKIDLTQDATNASSVRFYSSCVDRKVDPNAGEKHKLVYRLQGPETHDILAGKVRTKRVECKSHYKAIVAGFTTHAQTDPFADPGSMADPNPEFDPVLQVPKLWFLGMDPQPKNRDFKFLNSDASDHPVHLKAICLNYRTT